MSHFVRFMVNYPWVIVLTLATILAGALLIAFLKRWLYIRDESSSDESDPDQHTLTHDVGHCVSVGIEKTWLGIPAVLFLALIILCWKLPLYGACLIMVNTTHATIAIKNLIISGIKRYILWVIG